MKPKNFEIKGLLDIHIKSGIEDAEYWDQELGLIDRIPGQVVIRMGHRLNEQRKALKTAREAIALHKEFEYSECLCWANCKCGVLDSQERAAAKMASTLTEIDRILGEGK